MAMKSKTLNDQVLENIVVDIMNLQLEPGKAVSVQKLADRYGVSRTPVREAVVRLQEEGLVVIYPQSKTIVSKINLERIEQERFIRNQLELGSVEEFIQNCSVKAIAKMEECIQGMNGMKGLGKEYGVFQLDEEFHASIFKTAGLEMAYEVIQKTNTHYNRLRILSLKQEGIVEKIISEHYAILDAAKKRNGESMSELLEKHINEVEVEIHTMKKNYPEYFVSETD